VLHLPADEFIKIGSDLLDLFLFLEIGIKLLETFEKRIGSALAEMRQGKDMIFILVGKMTDI
jgi:hypothetical protein